MNTRTSGAFASAMLLTFGLGGSSAQAFIAAPIVADAASLSAAIPAAMCGNSCRNGGRYIPGPPSVCEDYDLNYCGPSRRGPQPGVGVYVPGTGIGIGVECSGGRLEFTISCQEAPGLVKELAPTSDEPFISHTAGV